MAVPQKEASSLLHSTAALRDRAAKAGLSSEEAQAIVDSNVVSIAQMAFAITPPGTSPTEQQVRDFYQDRVVINLGTITSTKLLIFEAHTLVVANIKSEVSRKDDMGAQSVLPSAERDRRIQDQRSRLTGLRFKGDEEVSYSSYDLVFTLLDKDTLTYLHPEKFVTRRFELAQKKPPKQLALDNDSLTVKEKAADYTCSTRTELELVQAFRRRALAFDLIGLVSYEIMNAYHAELLSHLQEDAPPGYSNTTVTQVLRADRAAFLYLAEILTSLKRDANGDLPLALELPKVIARPSVSFHLLPLATAAHKNQAAPKPAAANPNKRKHEETIRPSPKTGLSNVRKGKGKSKTKRGRGPNVPKDLVGKALETADGKRICWPYNLPNGCHDAPAGGQCTRGVHVCAEPGCGKAHSLQSHSWLLDQNASWFAAFEAKLSAKCRGKTSHELFGVEIFAGTSRLTASLRHLGFRDSFGIDHILSSHLAAPVLQLDLLKPECYQFVQQIIQEDACVYVHFAPPCGTASRARFIRRKGRYNPPVLRTDQQPDGLPGLHPLHAAKVKAANKLYQLTVDLCRLCHTSAVLYTIENPARSFMWKTAPFQQFLSEVPHYATYFHHCMYGSSRRKHTCLIHNIATVKSMQLLCDNQHPHEPWGQSNGTWATAQETAYPWPLSRRLATLVALHLQNLGVQCPTPSSAQQANMLNAIRQHTHVQTSTMGLPWVSEFSHTMQIPATDPVPPNARLISTPHVGEIASEGYKTVGVHRSPEEFIRTALDSGHPGIEVDQLPKPMKDAVTFTSEHSVETVARHRSEALRKMIHQSKQLATKEAALKNDMSKRRQEVLSGKRLLLFKELLLEAGSEDVNLVDDICQGFDLTGKLPASHHFNTKYRPAALPVEALRGVADRARAALLANVKSSGDPKIDSGVLQATLKERDMKLLKGPVDVATLPHGATLTRRFGVLQKEKVRPIDDYKASLVNSAVTQVEVVTLHGIDHIASLGAALMVAAGGSVDKMSLVAKCWDLASAYKQIPLSDDAYENDSYIVIYNPIEGKPEVYQQAVLPFGSIASVTAFLRCAMGIWHVGSSLLKMTWTSYFDDFLSLSPTCLARHTELCVSTLFQLLGWRLSEDKLVPYSQCCKVLGVEVDLCMSPSGRFEIRNTESRKQELVGLMQDILANEVLTRSEGERLRGRLQFASNQVFGRRFRNSLKELNIHVCRGFKSVSSDLAYALRMMVSLLQDNVPRPVDLNFADWVHIYVDASYEPFGFSGVGGMVLNARGECLGFFSEEVSQDVIANIKRADQETVIFELEGLAIAIAMYAFEKHVRGKRVVVFTDNKSAQSCLIKCKSENLHMNLIMRFICSMEERLGMMTWVERVPSQSNPADELSRKVILWFRGIASTRVDLLEMWNKCVAEKYPQTSQHKGESRETCVWAHAPCSKRWVCARVAWFQCDMFEKQS